VCARCAHKNSLLPIERQGKWVAASACGLVTSAAKTSVSPVLPSTRLPRFIRDLIPGRAERRGAGFTPARLRISRTLLEGDLVTQADEFTPKPAVPPGRILGCPLLRGWGIQLVVLLSRGRSESCTPPWPRKTAFPPGRETESPPTTCFRRTREGDGLHPMRVARCGRWGRAIPLVVSAAELTTTVWGSRTRPPMLAWASMRRARIR
jgi:hypothetical protein